MPPTGSISDPSQDRIRCSRSEGRTNASSGPTTVGPDTTKIAPSMSAAPADMPSNGGGEPRGQRLRDRPPPVAQAGAPPAGPPAPLPPPRPPAGVIKAPRPRQRNQWLERRPQQAVRINVGGQRADGETRREQN